MPQLKYKDPADGLWKPVPVGGAAAVVPNEVTVDAVEPTDGSELWLDVDEPNTNGGLLDQAAADDLYVNTTGDTMTGLLTLSGAPTLLTNAARWADGTPQFPNVAARDTAYLSIGGPVAGMICYMADSMIYMSYREGQWRPWNSSIWARTFYNANQGTINGGGLILGTLETSDPSHFSTVDITTLAVNVPGIYTVFASSRQVSAGLVWSYMRTAGGVANYDNLPHRTPMTSGDAAISLATWVICKVPGESFALAMEQNAGGQIEPLEVYISLTTPL